MEKERKKENTAESTEENNLVLIEGPENFEILDPVASIAKKGNVAWRNNTKCPICGKGAHYSSINSYPNEQSSARLFCPHCSFCSSYPKDSPQRWQE